MAVTETALTLSGTSSQLLWMRWLTAVGCVLAFLLPRAVTNEQWSSYAMFAGGAVLWLLGVARGVLFVRGARFGAEKAPAAVGFAVAQLGLALAWTLLAAGEAVDGQPLSEVMGVAGVVGWPALLATSAATMLFMELALTRMPVRASVDERRLRHAGVDGLSLSLSLIFVVSLSYATSVRDYRVDLSYFKTAMPSATTMRMVDGLREPVQAVLFFPEVSDVGERLVPYFEALAQRTDRLVVRTVDYALAPELVRKHQVRGNGFVALIRGAGDAEVAERIDVGETLETARRRLKSFDGRFQRAFAKLTMQKREVFFTVGHGERTDVGGDGDGPGGRTRLLTAALERANITRQELGLSSGLAAGISNDVPAVIVNGPREPFLPEEVESLRAYLRGGGRVAVLVDPDVEHGLDALFADGGVRMLSGTLVSDTDNMRGTPTAVFSSRYGSHPSVTMASRNASQVSTIFYGGGAVAELPSRDTQSVVSVRFPLRSGDSFFRDVDGDLKRGPDEAMESVPMMAASTLKGSKTDGESGDEGRFVLIADGDFATDRLIRNPGNSLIVGDVLQWFLGEEQVVGDVASEEDVRIEHTRHEDKLWFYGTSFGVPLPLFGLALWVSARRRRRSERASERRRPQGSGAERGGDERSSESAQDHGEAQ